MKGLGPELLKSAPQMSILKLDHRRDVAFYTEQGATVDLKSWVRREQSVTLAIFTSRHIRCSGLALAKPLAPPIEASVFTACRRSLVA
jgi:hypothetical protein